MKAEELLAKIFWTCHELFGEVWHIPVRPEMEVRYHREDGYTLDWENVYMYYAIQPRHWRPVEKAIISQAHGTVLDVGCGTGRISLMLKKHGIKVYPIDINPRMVKLCRKRGLKEAQVYNFFEIPKLELKFNTLIFMGNALAEILPSRDVLKEACETCVEILNERGKIIGSGFYYLPEHEHYEWLKSKNFEVLTQIEWKHGNLISDPVLARTFTLEELSKAFRDFDMRLIESHESLTPEAYRVWYSYCFRR